MVKTYKTYGAAVADFSQRMFDLAYGESPPAPRAWVNLQFAMRHFCSGTKLHPDTIIADSYREFTKKTMAYDKKGVS
jgi:hypothetical protein